MPVRNYKQAMHVIRILQEELASMRHQTYKTVHDNIGSTISAASIKAKLLGDKVKDSYEKQQLSEIHGLIKETVEHVTILNKKLKTTWIPQGTETLFSDIQTQLKKFVEKFGVHIEFQMTNESEMKKLSYPCISLIYEWVQACIFDALSRIASMMIFSVTILPNRIEWKFLDTGPLHPDTETYKDLIKKITDLSGTFHLLSEEGKNGALLVLPTKEDQ